jgi:hypothetical protein
MTTIEFMQNNKGYKPSKETQCASVFQDTRGIFYSYGYHYPLLFKVDDVWFVNDRGYSQTTSRHISWARGLASHSVELKGGASVDRNSVLDSLNTEKQNLVIELSKHRVGSGIYKSIEEHIEETKRAIKSIN